MMRSYVRMQNALIAQYACVVYGNDVCFTFVGKGDDKTACLPFHDIPLHGNSEVSNASCTV